jgi:hypothetical protein
MLRKGGVTLQTGPAMTTLVPRDSSGRFPKGVSGNPTGKPSDLKEIAALARSRAPEMIGVLAAIALDKSATEFARIAAANAILDRGLGKPSQALAIGVGTTSTPESFAAMLEALRSGGQMTRERFLPLIQVDEVADVLALSDERGNE